MKELSHYETFEYEGQIELVPYRTWQIVEHFETEEEAIRWMNQRIELGYRVRVIRMSYLILQ